MFERDAMRLFRLSTRTVLFLFKVPFFGSIENRIPFLATYFDFPHRVYSFASQGLLLVRILFFFSSDFNTCLYIAEALLNFVRNPSVSCPWWVRKINCDRVWALVARKHFLYDFATGCHRKKFKKIVVFFFVHSYRLIVLELMKL